MYVAYNYFIKVFSKWVEDFLLFSAVFHLNWIVLTRLQMLVTNVH